jgi:hypothetical protein
MTPEERTALLNWWNGRLLTARRLKRPALGISTR